MPIPAPYEVRLAAYGIDQSIDRDRRAVWEMLQPHLAGILERHLERAARFAPALAETLTKHRTAYLQVITASTAKLFVNPFDEQWVADAEARARFEIEHGLDSRSRPVVARSILAELSTLVSRRHRFSSRRAVRLLDIATRVLMLDAANAAACHNAAAAAGARADNDELARAIKEFVAAAEGVRGAISGAVADLAATSDRLTSLAATASKQATTAAGAAEQTGEDVRTTANAADELSSSIAEIHRQASGSAEMAQTSVSQVDNANATIRSLSDAVEKIGSVVGLISDIAGQTNLLALNATIEAARAGEAGRGFAVVASEVKSLATQTSKATDDIAQQIALIQEATRRSVSEIDHTRKTITEITAMTGAVAASVTQQTSATQSIAEGAARMAAHATTLARSLDDVQGTIGATENAAAAVIGLSRDLADRTGRLESVIAILVEAASKRGSAVHEFRLLK